MDDPRRERFAQALAEARRATLSSEAEVQRRVIEPCLEALGWHIACGVNAEIWLPLSARMAKFWNYPSGRMRRDYVLNREYEGPIHIEAKHNWARHTLDLERSLMNASKDDWTSTQKDGAAKDLALLLWGTRSQNGTRAGIVDDHRIIVFDWNDGWTLRSEEEILNVPTELSYAAFFLLAPSRR